MMESMKYTVVAVLKKVLGQLSSQAADDKIILSNDCGGYTDNTVVRSHTHGKRCTKRKGDEWNE